MSDFNWIVFGATFAIVFAIATVAVRIFIERNRNK